MKKRYNENDVNRAQHEGWRKGYALGVSLREARDEANELGYAARLARLKKRHANELREARDQARNAHALGRFEMAAEIGLNTLIERAEGYGYAKGFDEGKETGQRTTVGERNRLINDAYLEGREEGRAATTAEIKRERKGWLAQIKRTAYDKGQRAGIAKAIRILKENEHGSLPF